jgi:hypothetical protein
MGRSKFSHIFWETLGVVLGIYLVIIGIGLLLHSYGFVSIDKAMSCIGVLNIIFGLTGIIIDGFYFIPSFL